MQPDKSYLPGWDFGGDEAKRRAFIEWVEAELDGFAGLLHGRYPRAEKRDDWLDLLRAWKPRPRTAHRPPNPLAGMNGIVWEYQLIQYMFRRYWPGRKRPSSDHASALRIAVSRGRETLRLEDRSPHRLRTHREDTDRWVKKLQDDLERSKRSAGRREAAADIAYLDTLPAHHFAR